MLCNISELITEIPAAGDLVPRCWDYLYKGQKEAEIVISENNFRPDAWKGLTRDLYVYMESGSHFYLGLLKHNGMMLHSSAVAYQGRGYLFSGSCGTGKSTHTRLWQQVFGEDAKVFNDDKPALRRMEDRWYAYGTPWCGKDGININMKVPLGGICFLKQASENRIRRLSASEAVERIIWQTIYRFKAVENLDLMLQQVDRLVKEIPIYELENRPEPEAAYLSYETMRRGAEEAGL